MAKQWIKEELAQTNEEALIQIFRGILFQDTW